MAASENRLILRKKLCAQIKKDAAQKKILYFGTHTGWGKTTLLRQYAKRCGAEAAWFSTTEENVMRRIREAADKGVRHIVLDDLQLWDEEQTALLVGIITEAPFECRFYLVGRTRYPAFLKNFFATNQLKVYGIRELAISQEEAEELAALRRFKCTPDQIRDLREWAEGWLVGILFGMRRVDEQGKLDEQTCNLTELDVFDYLDPVFWNRLDQQMQNFFMNLAHLPAFTTREACMICGQQNVETVIQKALRLGSFLLQDGNDNYHFTPLCYRYLHRKQQLTCSEDYIRRRYESTALYFALQNDLPTALHYYDLAGDRQKIMELLVENSLCNTVGVRYFELEKYYLQLDEAEVDASPDLLGAMAMLHSLCMRKAESEACVEKLEKLENRLPAGDPRKKRAREKRAYLLLALPHNGSANTADTLKRLALLPEMRSNMQQLSISGNMPSIMAGGLDFCQWSKRDRLLYKSLGPVLDLVFGNYAQGMKDIALGESLFEKNYDGNCTECLMLLNNGQSRSEQCGNMQLVFAARGVTARLFAAQGSMDTALDMIVQLRALFPADVDLQLRRNVEAFEVWLRLLGGDTEAMTAWMEKEAPNEREHFYTLERMRYLTKVQGYMVVGRPLEALSLLDQLEMYFVQYRRTYNWMQARLIRSVILYRLKDQNWQDTLAGVLKIMQEHGFIRVGADLGIALLAPLQELQSALNPEYRERLLMAVKRQAVLYPQFLALHNSRLVDLTESEKSVLRLLTNGLTNAEICRLLGVSLPTVKTHTSNIYAKMGVKNRLAAVKLAQELKLI